MLRSTRRVPLSGMWFDSSCTVWRGIFDIFPSMSPSCSQRRILSTEYCLRSSFLLAGHPFLLPLRPLWGWRPVLGRWLFLLVCALVLLSCGLELFVFSFAFYGCSFSLTTWPFSS